MGDIYNEDPTHLFIGAEIKSLTEGSIVSQYYLSYEESSPVDGAAVGDILDAKLAHCVPGGPDCVVGNLYGINPTLSFANGEYKATCVALILFILVFIMFIAVYKSCVWAVFKFTCHRTLFDEQYL